MLLTYVHTYIHTYILLTYSAESLSVQCETSSNSHDFREKQQDPLGAEKSCHVKSDQPYLLCSGADIIKVSTSMKKLRKRMGSICFLCLTL